MQTHTQNCYKANTLQHSGLKGPEWEQATATTDLTHTHTVQLALTQPANTHRRHNNQRIHNLNSPTASSFS